VTGPIPSPGDDARLGWISGALVAVSGSAGRRQVSIRRYQDGRWSTTATCALTTWQSARALFLPAHPDAARRPTT